MSSEHLKLKFTDRVKLELGYAENYDAKGELDVVCMIVKSNDLLVEAAVVMPHTHFGTKLTSIRLRDWQESMDEEGYLRRVSPNAEKFIGKYFVWFYHNILKIGTRAVDGCSCSVCGHFAYMAEPNDPTKTIFTCSSCRDNPMRRFY